MSGALMPGSGTGGDDTSDNPSVWERAANIDWAAGEHTGVYVPETEEDREDLAGDNDPDEIYDGGAVTGDDSVVERWDETTENAGDVVEDTTEQVSSVIGWEAKLAAAGLFGVAVLYLIRPLLTVAAGATGE